MVSGANAFDLALIMHPTGPVRRTNWYSMVLILLSFVLATIVVGISMIRNHIAFGSFSRSGIGTDPFQGN
jgi:hypothetical protein